jgi:superfamily II DNA or RNA helicase
MKLEEYFIKFPKAKSTYSNRKFLEEIFYPLYGERGLDKLLNEEFFIDEENNRRFIDFVVKSDYTEYAIEIDDHGTHAPTAIPREAYSKDLVKKNSLIQKYGEHYTTIPLYDIEQNKERVENRLYQFFLADEEFNRNSQGFLSGEISPHGIQKETLNRLKESRDKGETKGLVCYATGLGKTFLSAFDAKSFNGKTLFIVHRDQILKKSKESFKKVWPEASSGFFNAEEKTTDKKIIFASVQTLYKENNLSKFEPQEFDYIILDETHHAADTNITYDNIIKYFKPKYLLGLTATPERSDEFNIIDEIYDGNLIYEISTQEAMDRGYLVEYEWRRHLDNVDYSNIRWNGRKYYEDDLNDLLVIDERDNLIVQKFKELKTKPTKTLVFCVNIVHAERLAEKFKSENFKSVVIHSDTSRLNKKTRLSNEEKFINSEVDLACVVDTMNEGIDIPNVDCLLLCRPTQSSTIAIQQFGRGLRLSHKKNLLRVMDFVGKNQKNALGVFKGITGDIDLPEKNVYFFNNNDSKIIFDEEVVDIFRKEQDLYSPRVNENEIPENWKEWGEYLKYQGTNNLYNKVGQQNKDIITQLKGCKILKDNPGISTENFNQKILEIDDRYHAGIRSMIFSKAIGLIDQDINNKPTKVFDEICSATSNFDELDSYKHIIENQLQKFCYWNKVFRSKDIRNPKSKSFNTSFKNFTFITLYKSILNIGEKTGVYEITYDEYRLFISIARNFLDAKDLCDHILSLRSETKLKYKIINYLNKTIDIGDRFKHIFKYSSIILFNEKSEILKIDSNNIKKAKSITDNYEKKLKNNKIPFPLENGERGEYEKMLYNPKPFWE